MNDDDRTLCRTRHRVRYSEFRTMPSKASTIRLCLREVDLLVVLVQFKLGIVPDLSYRDFKKDNRRSDGLYRPALPLIGLVFASALSLAARSASR